MKLLCVLLFLMTLKFNQIAPNVHSNRIQSNWSEVPFLVKLIVQHERTLIQGCSATLVQRNIAFTAAHCVYPNQRSEPDQMIAIHLAIDKRANCVRMIKRKVTKTHVRQEYWQVEQLSELTDFAILLLDDQITTLGTLMEHFSVKHLSAIQFAHANFHTAPLDLYGFGSDQKVLQSINSFDDYERIHSYKYIESKLRKSKTQTDYFKISYYTFTLKVDNLSFIEEGDSGGPVIESTSKLLSVISSGWPGSCRIVVSHFEPYQAWIESIMQHNHQQINNNEAINNLSFDQLCSPVHDTSQFHWTEWFGLRNWFTSNSYRHFKNAILVFVHRVLEKF